jgi:hypothetical protein
MPLLNHPVYKSVDLMRKLGPSTPFNSDGSRDYTYNFLVQTWVPADEMMAVVAPTIPRPFTLHPKDLAALVTNISAEMMDDEDPTLWKVAVRYSTRMPPGGPAATSGAGAYSSPDQQQGGQNNPELEPPDVEWDSETIQLAKMTDLDGKPFLNAANQPLTPAPVFDFAYPVLMVTRNELSYNNKTAARYSYAVNKEKFLGYEPKCVQCMPPKAKLMYRGLINFWRVSYRLRFGVMGDNGKPLPWDPAEFLNQGFMELKLLPGDPKPQPVPIKGQGGANISQPVLLNGIGRRKLPIMENGRWVVKPEYLKFRMRPSLSFKKLITQGLGAIL